ncbi:hypothetical protein QWJ90_11035 [Microbacterium oryzae]|uniref:hypothetical protein n=1 Tax=Microbacterium oryzae TaxID=743009 RepID=UPI0025AEEDC8|nr:hypothetical protein [Microbacterium oryzae]MDN3311464.1 hypothetical protein [Microbacterium oryzae]
MTSRQLRTLRGASASGIATVIAALSHTAGGAQAPAPLIVLAMASLLMPGAILLVGARPRLPRLAATVLTTQAAFHLAFLALGSPVTLPTAGSHAAHVAHAAHAAASSSTHLDHPTHLATLAASQTDARMIGAHLVAALLTVALLHRGETVLRAIASWASVVVRRVAPQPLLLAQTRAPGAAPARLPRALRIVAGARSPRGPPVLV